MPKHRARQAFASASYQLHTSSTSTAEDALASTWLPLWVTLNADSWSLHSSARPPKRP